MTRPGQPGRFALVTLDQWCAMVVGLAICLLPALPLFERRRAHAPAPSLALRMAMTLPLLLLTAGKVMTVTYNPFFYFRF